MNWVEEVSELHDFFEAWFAGRGVDMSRVEQVLDTDLTIVSPDGVERARDEILASIERGRGADPDLQITTSGHEQVATWLSVHETWILTV